LLSFQATTWSSEPLGLCRHMPESRTTCHGGSVLGLSRIVLNKLCPILCIGTGSDSKRDASIDTGRYRSSKRVKYR
jgi:hypothetical protein